MGQILSVINIIFGIIFLVCYVYQIVFIIISLVKKPLVYKYTDKRYRYAFLVAARNERNVIDQLCDSISAQSYPRELIDVYVVADNCSDDTAAVAREHGATVYERFNDTLKGKGYALSDLMRFISDSVGIDAYDGYFVVDADNILEPDYVFEMNKCFGAGEKIVVGYRNSKNFGDSPISAGYSVWFLRESRQLNGVRDLLGISCEVKGTGFLIHSDILKRQGGWNYNMLVEDVEFTVDNVLLGERIAYCDTAILYDEQPVDFKTSWWQRIRWCRGYIQVLRRYSLRLIKSFLKGRGFSNYDMFMSMSPAFFLSVASVAVNIVGLVATLIFDFGSLTRVLTSFAIMGVAAYVIFAIVALLTVMTERKRIKATVWQRISAVLTFPIFMATYIPIAAVSVFSRPEWRQVKHKRADKSIISANADNV